MRHFIVDIKKRTNEQERKKRWLRTTHLDIPTDCVTGPMGRTAAPDQGAGRGSYSEVLTSVIKSKL